MNLAPSTVVDRYTIESVLGRGGMAVVYRARHNQLGTVHAMKVLTLPLESIRQRMLQEGRVQAAMRHPNIVNVSDVIDVGGAPGLVMELIDGPSLYDLLEREPLSVSQVDALARGIVAGVAEAHRHGLIHRDLKPANILIAITPRGLVPKITDFGLAKVLDMSGGEQLQTVSGATMGTPQYMAPEQVRNAKSVDQRADVFAIGCILYEMLTARRPFEGEDLLETFTAIAAGKYQPILELAPDAPERMCRAIEAALVVDREQRIPDCDALLAIWTGEAAAAPVDTGPWDGAMLARAAAIKPVQPQPSTEAAPAPATVAPPVATPTPPPVAPGRSWVLPVAALALLSGAAAVVVAGIGIALYASDFGEAPAPIEPAAVPRSIHDDPEEVVEEPVVEPVAAEPVAEPVVEEPPPVVVPAPVVAKEPRVDRAPKKPVVVETGHLVVNTRPWSDSVTVDGKEGRRTPWKGDVPAGTHVITLHSSDGRSATHTLDVAAGSSTVLCWDFDLGGPCAR